MAFLTNTYPAHKCATRRTSRFFMFVALHRQRRALGKLDATRLKDIGLTRNQAKTEAHKPFWDIPAKSLK